MRFDYLRQPISDSEPCGPDLEAVGDASFLNYMMLVETKLPETFYVEGQPVDVSKLDPAREAEDISRLLESTRDLRLLVIDAQFHALAGDLHGAVEALSAIAALVVDFWDSVHPRSTDGDFIFRQNAIEPLNGQSRVILPLQHAPIVGGGRQRRISYRHYLVATGKAPARLDEDTVQIDEIQRDFARADNAGQLDAVLAATASGLSAIETISATFLAHDAYANVPNLDRLKALLTDIGALITGYRPQAEPAQPQESRAEEPGAGAEPVGKARATAPVGRVADRADVSEALAAAGSYFHRMEPSSPAFILIHQARMLVGRPLTEALEALMPEDAQRALLKMDMGFPFEIDLTRMKAVTDHAYGRDGAKAADGQEAEASEAISDDTEASPDAGDVEAAAAEQDSLSPARTFSVSNRTEAAEVLIAVETFYRTAEPSSPIPVLLAKARNYLNRDFSSILNEMVAREV